MLKKAKWIGLTGVSLVLIVLAISTFAQPPLKGESSYSAVVIKESFEAIMARMKAAKPAVMKHTWISWANGMIWATVRPWA